MWNHVPSKNWFTFDLKLHIWRKKKQTNTQQRGQDARLTDQWIIKIFKQTKKNTKVNGIAAIWGMRRERLIITNKLETNKKLMVGY